MLSISLLVSALMARVTAGAALPLPGDDDIPGYEMADIKWEFQPKNSGSKVYISGTVDQVHEELSRRYPNWKEEFEPAKDILAKRTDFPYNDILCSVFPQVSDYWIQEAIDAVQELGGQPSLEAKQCGRVACKIEKKSILNFTGDLDGGSVVWCNDSNEKKTLDSYGPIFDGATAIQNKCSDIVYSGQAFTSAGWNVIVRKQDKC